MKRSIPLFAAALLLVGLVLLAGPPSGADATAEVRKVVLIAGPPSHASGEHEFNAGAILLARALNEQSGLPIEVEVVHNGWPEDESVFDGVDAIVIYADGMGRHPANNKWEFLDGLMAEGVGLMCMHYAVHVPIGDEGAYFQRWIGGYYKDNHSVNPHWAADTVPHETHPVGNGVAPVKVHDEWYFNMSFNEPATHEDLLVATPTYERIRQYIHWNRPGQDALGTPQTLMWGVQREDGGRGVGFTGGHWHYNWAVEDYRRMVLNAIVWVAGLEVPEEGVKSLPLTEEDLNANLDEKPEMRHVALPGDHLFEFEPAAPRVID